MRVKHDGAIGSAFRAVYDAPLEAIRLADGVIDAPSATAAQRAEARWARGMARRERGELQLGADDLFAARQEAAGVGDDVLAARIDTSLALIGMYTGSADGALEILAQAEPHLRGADLARLENQRALVHHRAGDLVLAERSYRTALRRADVGDDPIGRIRILMNLGLLEAQQGRLAAAERALGEAVTIAEAEGQRFLAAANLHNLGYARSRAGRIPAALENMSAAEALLADLARPELLVIARVDRAELLLRSNVLDEACSVADRALDGVRRLGNETEVADTALLAARCRLAAGRFADARAAADDSVESFRRQGREAWLALAEFVRAQIDAADRGDVASGAALLDVAADLDRFGWSGEALAARVLAGQLLLRAGHVAEAAEALDGLRVVADRPAGERASVHLARGLVAEARGDRDGARRSVRLGLRVVSENQASLAGVELRSFAAGHGAALVELGCRLAVADHHPRELLERAESTRRVLWLTPRVRPPDDAELADLLAELRTVAEDLRAAIGATNRDDDGAQRTLRHRRAELERAIRDHTRRGEGAGGADDLPLADAIAALGDHVLVEYVDVGGALHAVSVISGRAELHDLGPVDGLATDVDACTFALHRLNRTQGSTASRTAATATLDALGRDLDRRLVPDRARRSGRPLVVVPAGPLHGLAWGALPSLAGRPVSVAPSLTGWAAARLRPAPARGGVLVAAGPGLPGAAAEVAAIARLYRRPHALGADEATAERMLHALGRSRLAHLACHGSFRADNPLFSTLTMADGPLTVYDLERCPALPRVIVLSACNVATSSVLRGGTLLGLASSLMTFGAATVIAPLTPVHDERVVDVMVGVHRRLGAGDAPAAALAAASEAGADPTAAAFVCLGA